ncbi:transmembrane protein 120A-like [Stylophora pistillata]|uniref:Transmembrane protein 120B n=1 Tax=Stylophora pistillata TaxID=50429 RepID=A0A2B4SS88_STYPI|nr:transmembrane protein 120A-like [Stylophora pistillata]PFX31448.1 Transmembrane protein 120B [Stylophora pistillata]
MAAIAEISSLQEWEEEWQHLEEETRTFKQTKFQDYQQKLDEFHSSQKSCVSAVNQQKRKLRDFQESLKRFKSGSLTGEQQAQFAKLQTKISDFERKIKDFELSLPSQAGLFLKLCLGNINVSLYNSRMAYKDDYEKFKLKMTVISMVFTILNLYIFNYRIADALFHAMLLWYYSTLTLQEHILIANGSRIKGWWVVHHYLSIILSGFLLIWPDGRVYQIFRGQFFHFSLYLSFVQLLQFRYQSRALYRLRSLGVSKDMDVTREGFHSWMWRGLGFIIPFLIVGYLFQLFNAYTLYRLHFHPDCTEWQVLGLSVVFFILFAGNMTTLLFVVRQKFTKTGVVPQLPCS